MLIYAGGAATSPFETSSYKSIYNRNRSSIQPEVVKRVRRRQHRQKKCKVKKVRKVKKLKRRIKTKKLNTKNIKFLKTIGLKVKKL